MYFNDKIISYLKCDVEKYNWIFPPMLFYIVIGIIILILPITCSSNKEAEVKHLDLEIPIDTTSYPAEQVVIDEVKDFSVPKTKYWLSQEVKLPIGIVHNMDFAHGDKKKPDDYKDNYVTVKRLDGSLTITKDIDEDLYLNIDIGDTIK